jgi:hypothetical protein
LQKFPKIDFKSRGCVSISLQPSGSIMHVYFHPVIHAVQKSILNPVGVFQSVCNLQDQ